MSIFRSYASLAARAFLMTLFLACLAIFGEIAFVLIAKIFGRPIQFSSFYALIVFSGLAGFVPLSATPNRLSDAVLSAKHRVLLVFEIALLVTIAIVASASYMANKAATIDHGVELSVGAYCFALVISLIVNQMGRR